MTGPRKNVVGFMHVCLINNWQEIVNGQFQIMRESGLMDYLRVINICAVGPEAEYAKLLTLIRPHQKMQIGAFSQNLQEYEYISLRFLHETAKRGTQFYGFYVHTKGVSTPGNEGGKYWLDYMNHFNLRLWKEAIKHLDLGYETCGVKYINKQWPAHYSGNFFWFDSSYVATLPDVNRMNLRDRFNAEMWICSGKAIAATLSQEFVDYNTKGIFKPPKTEAELREEQTENIAKASWRGSKN